MKDVYAISLLLFSFPYFCRGQVVGSGTFCAELGNCSENASCIGSYYELEVYIKGNREVIKGLKNAFFATGETPSTFVKLLYNFQVSNSTNNLKEFDYVECSNTTTAYIWSESALYLLGPRTLVWFTFFAISTPEISVAVQLPCICNDVYSDLLSRLTYMV